MSVFCDKDADLTPEFTTECYVQRKFIAEGKIPQGEEKANTILCRTASASSRAPVAQRRLAVQSLPNRECIRIPQARRRRCYLCALDHRQSSGLLAKPAFTGLCSMYFRIRSNCAMFRIQWSNDSSCQNALPVRPNVLFASLAETPLIPPVIRRNGTRGVSSTCTWLGTTTYACRK